MKRKSLSKKIRFEVFKRDKFTCQYCGRSAPYVVLECDHINPVSNGGDNNIMNLVTSCFECNRGKSKTLLSDDSTVKKQKAQADLLQEKTEQMKMMCKWYSELSKQQTDMIDSIELLYNSYYADKYAYTFIPEYKRKLRGWIKKYGFQEVYECCEIAFCKYDDVVSLNKVGGILYNRHYNIHPWYVKKWDYIEIYQ